MLGGSDGTGGRGGADEGVRSIGGGVSIELNILKTILSRTNTAAAISKP